MSNTPERRTLLLIHGFPLDHALWDPNIEALSQVADVIVPDLRGFGSSTAVPEVLTMEDYAGDLHELLDAKGIGKVVLCGLSMGGYVALAFLERWPERVEGLILCNTRSGADTEEGKAAREETARNAFGKGVDVIARGMVSKVLSAPTRTGKPELVAGVETMMARQQPHAVAAASRGMAKRPDRTPMLASITVPTLVITGDSDELMPLPTSRAMADAIPGARLVVLPHAGHLSNMEAPADFNATVGAFLASMDHA